MDGILNETQLSIVKEFQFDKPLFQKIDCIKNILTHLIINVNMILNLQIPLKMTQLIIQLAVKNMKLYELKKTNSCSAKRLYI